ncbi:Slx4p interacting protein [Polyrhizophydium stewartii]|uniref:Slx4p interacting protein n=1 Tax=Polyrhizophydium stewartii TaxID=2732419 RepID=A0ABR4NH39_9FUNG
MAAAAAPAAAPRDFFYACYLLQSQLPGRDFAAYVGSTPDPRRRLRQHNGEIVGGAKKTRRNRPWDMVVVVHGFASEFEWAWQYPHKSRHVRTGRFTGRRRELFVNAKLDVLAEMLHAEYWTRWPLRIHFTNAAVQRVFEAFRRPPAHVQVTFGPLEDLVVAQRPLDAPGSVNHRRVPLVSQEPDGQSADLHAETDCIICFVLLDAANQSSFLRCSRQKCKMRGHVICLSNWFIEEERMAAQAREIRQILPIGGSCPICRQELNWGELVRDMRSRAAEAARVLADPNASRRGADDQARGRGRTRQPDLGSASCDTSRMAVSSQSEASSDASMDSESEASDHAEDFDVAIPDSTRSAQAVRQVPMAPYAISDIDEDISAMTPRASAAPRQRDLSPTPVASRSGVVGTYDRPPPRIDDHAAVSLAPRRSHAASQHLLRRIVTLDSDDDEVLEDVRATHSLDAISTEDSDSDEDVDLMLSSSQHIQRTDPLSQLRRSFNNSLAL